MSIRFKVILPYLLLTAAATGTADSAIDWYIHTLLYSYCYADTYGGRTTNVKIIYPIKK